MNRRHFTKAAVGLTLAAGLALSGCSANKSGSAVSASATGTAAGAGTNKSVTIGYIAWDENVADSFLWKHLLEKQGYTVNLKQLEVAALYSGVSDGQLDMYLCAVPKTHEDYFKRFDGKFKVVGQWFDTLSQGVAVPAYTGLKTMDDLAGKADQFKGQIVGIEAGSGLMRQMKANATKDYDLSGYKVLDGSTPAMLAALDKAIKAKEPIAVALWQPHWAFSKYPVVLLEDPKGSFGGNDVYKSAISLKFAESNPEVVKQIEKFHLTPDQLQSLELKITEAGQGKESEAVAAWVTANEAVVKAWTGQ